MEEKVTQYIDKQKSLQKKILQKIRKLIQKTAPTAIEAMSYGVPAFKLKGGNLILYAAFTNHIGIYPEPDAIKVFAKELSGYETAKGTIKFKLNEPIPYDLIEKIVRYRVKMFNRGGNAGSVLDTISNLGASKRRSGSEARDDTMREVIDVSSDGSITGRKLEAKFRIETGENNQFVARLEWDMNNSGEYQYSDGTVGINVGEDPYKDLKPLQIPIGNKS